VEVPAHRVAPVNVEDTLAELEGRLAQIWGGVLGRAGIGPDENFFAVGGDSQAAAEIAGGVQEEFGVELGVRDFARTPTVASMAERIERLGVAAEAAGVVRVPRDRPLPCSLAQERIWPFSRDPETAAQYTIVSENRLLGPLSVAALREALEDVVRAHEVLHSTFVERDGVPLQVIQPAGPIDVPLINLGETDHDARTQELFLQQAAEPFDLEHGPLLRMQVVRVAEGDHRLLRASQHLLSDRVSWRIFFADLALAYEARRRGKKPFTRDDRLEYADFAIWERDRLRPDGTRFRREVEWWRRRFEPERPPQVVPFGRAEPFPEAPVEDARVGFGIRTEESRALDDVARSVGATSYAARLAVFAALIGIETGAEEVQLGAYATNRRTAEAQSVFGFFSNMITLILPFDAGLSFRDWLVRVMGTVADAGARRQVPYERLCEELRRDGVEPPEIRLLFHMYEDWGDVGFEQVEAPPPRYWFPGMPWGFTFIIDRSREADGCKATFDARIYDPVAVRKFVERFNRMVVRVGQDADLSLGDLAGG
jgi:acyl carrier protein